MRHIHGGIMRTRTQRLFRLALAALSLGAAAVVAPRDARAEVDAFGLGNGHSGAYVAAAPDEVINAYAPLTADAAKGATSITIGAKLGAATGLAVGDLVMVWRATGIAGADAPSASQAAVNLETATAGVVGRFELARVSAATATTLTFTKPLTQAFAKDLTQVVSIPEYSTMTIAAGTGPAALAWQTAGTGFAGGIVAFLATGAATINGHVNADARGFRGGKIDANTDVKLMCAASDGLESDGYAAKGEGVVAAEFGGTTHGGKGNRANGAGGGNCAENGGGGGGNAGVGGAGGNSILGTNSGGLGGAKLDYSLLTRIDMGGGGGAGEQKNGVGSGGGAGGGVVFARVASVAGAGQITANGETAANAGILGVESDGAGGGGAGGSIIIRAVGAVQCSTAETKGGNGGSTAVIGLGTFGPGGGGAGGRVLIQATTAVACPLTVTAGAPGTAGMGNQRGATAGSGGATQDPAAGIICFENTAADPQCSVATAPVCDPASGECVKCNGPFGGGSSHDCQIAVDPVCKGDGSCNPCLSDFGVASDSACQLTGAPYCFLTGPTTGACGKCSTSADCTPGLHGGTVCEPISGSCGAPCTVDSDCKTAEWCAGTPGVCVPKTPNGEHVPAQPPINGMCTMQNGMRVCLSAVCEMDDNLCGLHNGSPCAGMSAECRSTICFPGDSLCGKPTGEPCALNGDCRSDMCVGGVCSGCTDDSNCGSGKVCDKDRAMCVAGCREVGGKSNCIAPLQCSKHDGTIGTCIDGGDGGADGGAEGGAVIDDSGSIEGGGCACRTSMPIEGSPLALAAAVLGALVIGARRRRDRQTSEKQAESTTETKTNTQERG
jgi:MYXO-CTERM domain-containing protein